MFYFFALKQQLRRGRKSKERSGDSHVKMNVLRHQALPDPPANQQQPSSSQSDVLLVSGDVTSTHIPFPRHYVTPLPGRDSDGYEVPIRDSDGYEVPVYNAHCANQEPLYSEIQDGEDNYDDTEVI